MCAVLLELCALRPALPAQDIPHSAFRTPHFIIHHDPDTRVDAVGIGDACEQWLTDISRRLDLKDPWPSPIPVFLYRNQTEFSRATGRDQPGDVVGQASSLGDIQLDASGTFASPEQIAGHEITHLIIFRILSLSKDGRRPDAIPLWLNEGTAKYMTNDWDIIDRTVLADAVIDGTIMPLESLTRTFPTGQRQGVAYAEGTSAVTFFVKTYGEKALARLIHRAATARTFDDAMREVTGGSVAAFESRWRPTVEGNYIVLRITRFSRVIGLAAMPLMVFLAYLAFRRRRQRMIEKYEEIEEE